MSEAPLAIRSQRGPYVVLFEPGALRRITAHGSRRRVLLVDAKVARLYAETLAPLIAAAPCLVVEATEANKSLDRVAAYVEELARLEVRRDDELVAIGGGIVQDITCFLAGIYLRGLPWVFYPTTLLAQADSCVGSKSSINVGGVKNLLGTFTPPRAVYVDREVLGSLAEHDLRSGIGEILKVHAIEGPEAFDALAADYPRLLSEPDTLQRYVAASLRIKRRFVEEDELDVGPRGVLNYGHSFGHAIESASGFAVPHGIAVTMGIDLANAVAVALGRMDAGHHARMGPVLRRNYADFAAAPIAVDKFWAALARDKKNTSSQLGLVLPGPDARPSKVHVRRDRELESTVEAFFARS